MSSSRVFVFDDPQAYTKTIRATEVEIYPTTRGDFRAELTQVDLGRLWMQRGRESLPRVYLGAISKERAAIGFLADADQPAIQHRGMAVSPGEIIVNDWNAMHRRSFAPCHWAAMSLTPKDLAAAGRALVGRDLTVPSTTYRLRPSSARMSRLSRLHEKVGQMARDAPGKLTQPEVARSLEQALVHAMIGCLTESASIEMGSGARHHAAGMARLEEFVSVNHDRPVYLAEVCAATGMSERTLRVCCHEQLGMGPIRYLWLRRMHLVHRALFRARPEVVTVTGVATEYGFWELGRFAVEYRALFGETPSATLLRSSGAGRTFPGNPLALPAAGFA